VGLRIEVLDMTSTIGSLLRAILAFIYAPTDALSG
jgi:hypothetical protein